MINIRIISFIGVICMALFAPLWTFVIASCLYTLFFRPYEILILALFIDAQFGEPARGTGYLYTVIAATLLIVAGYIRPYIRFYS